MIKKKKMTVLCAVCAMLAFLAAFAAAEPAEAKQKAAWNYKKTLTKTSGAFTYHAYPSKKGKEAWIYKIDIQKKKKPASISIPKKIDGRKVTRIGSKATDPQGEGGVNLFGACIEREHDYSRRAVTNKTIKKIVIPDTVEEIQPSSFCGMIALKSIKIPKKVKALKEETFYACAGLEEVSLPAGLEKLDPAAFQDCPSLKKMGLPKKNKIFRMEGNCVISKKLQKVIYTLPGGQTLSIPEGVKSIGKYALNNCTAPRVEIPASVTEIEGEAFHRPLLGPNTFIKDVAVSADSRTYAKDGQCVYHKLDQSLAVAIPDEKGVLYISEKVESLTNTHSLVNCDANKGAEKVVFPKTLNSVIVPSFSISTIFRNVYFLGETPPRVTNHISGYASLPIFTHVYVPASSEELYRAWYTENHCSVNDVEWHIFQPGSEI